MILGLLEQARQNSVQFLEQRPTLKANQKTERVVHLLANEVREFAASLEGKDREEILDEFTDVVNFVGQALANLEEEYGITCQEVADKSRYKYRVRNAHKYPPEDYQEGDAIAAQEKNILQWAILQAYSNTPEQGLGGEYY